MGLSARRAVAAHVLHRQPGHRQDHGGHAHGRDPAPPRLLPQGPRGRRHARRSRRPVHRAHGAQDQGRPQAGDGRRAVHRRGVLPAPPGEREGLRPGGDRDPAAGDGEPARRPRGHPRRLRGPHGPVLRVQPGHGAAASRTTSTFPDYTQDELFEIAEKMLAEWNYRFDPAAAAAFREYLEVRRERPHFANARSVRNALDRIRLRQALRLFEERGTRADRRRPADDPRARGAREPPVRRRDCGRSPGPDEEGSAP